MTFPAQICMDFVQTIRRIPFVKNQDSMESKAGFFDRGSTMSSSFKFC